MRLFPKTFLYTLALLVLIAGLANGLIYTMMPSVYTKQKQQELTARADLLAQKLGSAEHGDIVGLMGSFAAQGQTNITIEAGSEKYALIVWSNGPEYNGAVTYVTVTSEGVADAAGSSAEAYTAGGAVNATGTEVAVVESLTEPVVLDSPVNMLQAQRAFTMGGEAGMLTLAMTLAPVQEAVGVILSLLPISILLCFVIAVIFSLLYARALTRPIKAISAETRRMTLLERNAECRISARDEIGTLAVNVNGLYTTLLNTIDSLEAELKKVATADKSKTDFLRAASHELKTPVTAVGVIMDNMILGVGKYRNHDEWLPKCRELVDSLSQKLRDILDASHLEAVSEPSVTGSVETRCAEVLEPYLLIARARGLSLYIDWSASFQVTAPQQLLSKALSSIFSNAVRYAAPGGRLSVYCRGHSLIVENECAPIPDDQLHRLCEPFYRPDVSRNRETGGNGLGLYIVETILRRLELDYSFEPMTSPEGMRFTVNF